MDKAVVQRADRIGGGAGSPSETITRTAWIDPILFLLFDAAARGGVEAGSLDCPAPFLGGLQQHQLVQAPVMVHFSFGLHMEQMSYAVKSTNAQQQLDIEGPGEVDDWCCFKKVSLAWTGMSDWSQNVEVWVAHKRPQLLPGRDMPASTCRHGLQGSTNKSQLWCAPCTNPLCC